MAELITARSAADGTTSRKVFHFSQHLVQKCVESISMKSVPKKWKEVEREIVAEKLKEIAFHAGEEGVR